VLPEGATLPAEAAADERFATIAVRRRPGPLHFALTLPGALRRLPLDVAFSVTHAPLRPGVPVALMVNDLSFLRRPGDYPVASRARLRAMVAAQVRAASVVTTVSEFCRDDILDAYRLDRGRVLVVPNTFDPPLDLRPEEKESGQDWLGARGVTGPYFLYLGNVHARKNVDRLVRAFQRARTDPGWPDHQLVIAGGSWWGAESPRAASAPSVVALGRVSDAVREVLLCEATALVYVSLFEGFGLPPLEAMVRGTPVIASATTAIPEVVADAGVLVDPTDEDAIAGAMLALAADPTLRASLAARGRGRGAAFSVEQTGRRAHAALVAAAAVR
jgi:glycosyltransferase involved in cell wall biosynthesis